MRNLYLSHSRRCSRDLAAFKFFGAEGEIRTRAVSLLFPIVLSAISAARFIATNTGGVEKEWITSSRLRTQSSNVRLRRFFIRSSGERDRRSTATQSHPRLQKWVAQLRQDHGPVHKP